MWQNLKPVPLNWLSFTGVMVPASLMPMAMLLWIRPEAIAANRPLGRICTHIEMHHNPIPELCVLDDAAHLVPSRDVAVFLMVQDFVTCSLERFADKAGCRKFDFKRNLYFRRSLQMGHSLPWVAGCWL